VSTCIRVSVGPAIRGAELHPLYDSDAGILAVTAETSREWTHGIDIDGNIVFDADRERILANFDLHVPRRRWKNGPSQLWPESLPRGVIVFSEDTLKHKSFNLPLVLSYDPGGATLRIGFGDGQANRLVSLSRECVAFLSGDDLTGFLIRGL
jgi:hypothetical protein